MTTKDAARELGSEAGLVGHAAHAVAEAQHALAEAQYRRAVAAETFLKHAARIVAEQRQEAEAFGQDKATAWAATLAEDFDPWTEEWSDVERLAGERTLALFAARLRLDVKLDCHKNSAPMVVKP